MNILIIGVVILTGFVMYRSLSKSTNESNAPYDPKFKVEKIISENDKLIIVHNAHFEVVKQVVKDFTRNYDNEEQKHLKPFSKLYKIDESKSAILFPYDIDFEIFCYYLNYLKYPIDIDYSPIVIGWTTTKSKYSWLNSNFENMKVMLFIDPTDQEYDNVMLTTVDNEQYKLGFAVGYGLQKTNTVIQEYQNNPIDLTSLMKNKSVEIE